MLGPRSRGPLPSTRRERWRVIVVVVVCLLVGLVVGEVADQVVKSSSGVGRRTDKTWLAAVSAIVAESNTLAPTLDAIRSDATDPAVFDRVTLEFSLRQLAQDAETDANIYRLLGLAAPSNRADLLMTAVLGLRHAGAENLAAGVELAISGRDEPSTLPRARQFLATAGSRFAAADAGYHALVFSLAKNVDALSLPSSVWVRSPAVWSASAVGAWANELRSAASLALSAALSIVAVTLEPPPLEITGLPTTTTTTTTLAPTTSTTTVARGGHARRQPPTTTSSPTTTTSSPSATTSTSAAPAKPTTSTMTLPAPTTSLQIPPAGSVSVVAATSRLEVVVVVKNIGDTIAKGAYVTAVASPARSSHTGAARVGARHGLLTLSPGSSEYVVMPKLVVKHATRYELIVIAAMPNGRSDQRSIALYVSS